MTTTAYTVGRAVTYDRCLAEMAELDKPMRKVGKGDIDNSDPEYPGGCVWKTADEASESAPEGYAAYELELPGPWHECVYEAAGGGHHLLIHVRIVRRVLP